MTSTLNEQFLTYTGHSEINHEGQKLAVTSIDTTNLKSRHISQLNNHMPFSQGEHGLFVPTLSGEVGKVAQPTSIFKIVLPPQIGRERVKNRPWPGANIWKIKRCRLSTTDKIERFFISDEGTSLSPQSMLMMAA